jgi:stearoyl-CoA desaturase (delta-9 desaturase)
MKTKGWHRTLGAWAFIPALYFSLGHSWSWFAISFVIYICIALTVTVGYHRLFSHNSFECSKYWHWIFGLIGTISLNSSPVHWASVHMSHHKFSDTEDDPYEASWKYFFRFKERENINATRNVLLLMRDPMHKFFVNNSLSLSIVFGLFILGTFGITPFLFLYALPVTTYLVTAGLHTIYAHGPTGVRNLWLLEILIPMAGEWIHKEHHARPKMAKFNTKPHFLDLGGVLIGAIENGRKPSTQS